MAKKQFKTESKKLLDMMINSIYTHKEIFLRELISNASDAIDKLYFRSLTDDSVNVKSDEYEIRISIDKQARTLTLTDNGIGMTKEELENNLGTIAKSGSYDFKNNSDNQDIENIDIIGQFGVGFYSAFMVSDKIVVESRVHGNNESFCWTSTGADGYTITECNKDTYGTKIILHIKEDTDDEKFEIYLEEYKIRELIKKYSDYIRYPIKMLVSKQELKEGSENEYETITADEILNSMIPLWKKNPSEVTDDDYANFYREKFYDFQAPIKTIRQKAEGTTEYTALLFIPSHAPFDYYSRDYEKGLQLYSSGVMIMDKCKDLLPDYFSFVKGLVDSSDLSLNISREMLQHDRQLKAIAKALEKKISGELEKMLKNDRDKYEEFYKAFGAQLKWGIYNDYGMHKDVLQNLLMFKSSKDKKLITLKEYVERMSDEQNKIYYASGDTVDKIELLPQVESVIERGYEVLYLTEDVDEFALQMLRNYNEKEFLNVCTDSLDLDSDEEKETLNEENKKNEELFSYIKDCIGDGVTKVRFTNKLQKHPVCLTTEGAVSMGMEKVLNKMPGAEDNKVKAEIVLEININHPLAKRLTDLYENDKEKLSDYSIILYAQARLISGLSIDNPAEISDLVCNMML
ncbi:MAG: molecular chaperone HtpG [Clostridia bacterium]|nr:molecular chaperone HtpG [Clostridia bacterium]